MKSLILGLLAETSIHPGAGQSSGFVDLPVAREAATDYPVIVGSSMKGALRDMAFQSEKDVAIKTGKSDDDAKKIALSKVEPIFGKQENAGALLVSDARLILLPVRSLKTQYKWVTCPHLIERLSRDRSRENGLSTVGRALLPVAVEETGKSARPTVSVTCPAITEQQYLGAGDGDLFLEERQFSRAGELPEKLIELVSSLIAHETTAKRLAQQLVVISNDDFVWFARYGLAVNARNQLDDEKKTSKNLWYEETIPPDSLFYCLLAERGANALASMKSLFKDRPYLQAGGNETVGQGWFAVAFPTGNGGGK